VRLLFSFFRRLRYFLTLPIISILRILVLLMTIIPDSYWKLFSMYIIISGFLIAELVIQPWRLRSVQFFSICSYFLLLFAISILFRPASMLSAFFSTPSSDF
jgi:hypothetical protein